LPAGNCGYSLIADPSSFLMAIIGISAVSRGTRQFRRGRPTLAFLPSPEYSRGFPAEAAGAAITARRGRRGRQPASPGRYRQSRRGSIDRSLGGNAQPVRIGSLAEVPWPADGAPAEQVGGGFAEGTRLQIAQDRH